MKRYSYLWLLPLLLVAGSLVVLVGCESDETAPNESPPPLTAAGAAQQAGTLAYMVGEVMGVLENLSAKEVRVESFSYISDNGIGVQGTVTIDFRTGGPTGTPAPYTTADYAHVFTDSEPDEGPPQIVNIVDTNDDPDVILGSLTADLEVNPYAWNSGSPNGTINGDGEATYGSFPTGPYVVTDVVFATGSYPSSGTLTYTVAPMEAVVTFSGIRYARVVVSAGEEEILVAWADLDNFGELCISSINTFVINDDAAETDDVNVTLTMDVECATQMRFQNEGDAWSTWEPYATTRAWTLPAGDGTKTVNALFYDIGGDQLEASDTIELNTVTR